MRYLRRYNEELEPYTYRKVAGELSKKGGYHAKRGEEMGEYASLVEWRRLRDRCKRAGEINVRLKTGFTNHNNTVVPEYVGKFYPVVDIGLDMFAEGVDYEISNSGTSDSPGNFTIALNWFVSATPTDEDGYEQAHASAKRWFDRLRSGKSTYDKSWGFPMAFFHFDIVFEGGSYSFGKPQFYKRDDTQVDAVPEDRAASGKIRAEILRQLDVNANETHILYLDGEKHVFDNGFDALEAILQFYGLGSDYGLEAKAIFDYVKNLPGGFFTC